MSRVYLVAVVCLGLALAGSVQAASITQSINEFYITVQGNTNGQLPSSVVLQNTGQSTSGMTTVNMTLDLAGNGFGTLVDPTLTLSFLDLDVVGQVISRYFLRESVVVSVNGTQVWNSSLLPPGVTEDISGIDVDLGFLNGQNLASLDLEFKFTGQLWYFGRNGNTTAFRNTAESVTATFNSGEEIPEPTTIALLGAGAVALAARRRRREAA